MGGRILLVDDDPNICETAQDILEDAGFQVKTAGSLSAALACLESDVFDVMIVDLNLPDGSGLDFSAKVRTQLPKLRILLMTGQAEGAEPAGLHARNEGVVDDYLVKPVSPPQLINRINRALS